MPNVESNNDMVLKVGIHLKGYRKRIPCDCLAAQSADLGYVHMDWICSCSSSKVNGILKNGIQNSTQNPHIN